MTNEGASSIFAASASTRLPLPYSLYETAFCWTLKDAMDSLEFLVSITYIELVAWIVYKRYGDYLTSQCANLDVMCQCAMVLIMILILSGEQSNFF